MAISPGLILLPGMHVIHPFVDPEYVVSMASRLISGGVSIPTIGPIIVELVVSAAAMPNIVPGANAWSAIGNPFHDPRCGIDLLKPPLRKSGGSEP